MFIYQEIHKTVMIVPLRSKHLGSKKETFEKYFTGPKVSLPIKPLINTTYLHQYHHEEKSQNSRGQS